MPKRFYRQSLRIEGRGEGRPGGRRRIEALPVGRVIGCQLRGGRADRAVSNHSPQDPKVGSFAHFESWGSKIVGLMAKRPSKRPRQDPKNRFMDPNFENPESNLGSQVLILRIRYSSNFELTF